jgi:hypothetical protein
LVVFLPMTDHQTAAVTGAITDLIGTDDDDDKLP